MAEETFDAGAVRPDELEVLLNLLCEAYGMDVDAARPIFYSDPFFEIANKRVLRRNGQIVSCLTIVERECWLGQSILRIAGIAGVATAPNWQRRGYAGRLLIDTLHVLKARGFHFAALFPFSQDYYRKFGWEVAGSAVTARLRPSRSAAHSGPGCVRRATEADIPAFAELYRRSAQGRAFHCLREEKRWHYLFAYVQEKVVYTSPQEEHHAPEPHATQERARGRSEGSGGERIEGYALYDYQRTPAVPPHESAGGEGGRSRRLFLRILETVAETQAARRSLLGYLGQLPHADRIEYTAPEDHLAESGFTGSDVPGTVSFESAVPLQSVLMVRIVDARALLTAFTPNWTPFQGNLGLTVRDPLLGGPPLGAIVAGSDTNGSGTARIEFVEADRVAGHCPDRVEGDVQAWSSVMAGHIPGDQACKEGILRATTEEAVAMAGWLFPRRSPFLPVADHF